MGRISKSFHIALSKLERKGFEMHTLKAVLPDYFLGLEKMYRKRAVCVQKNICH